MNRYQCLCTFALGLALAGLTGCQHSPKAVQAATVPAKASAPPVQVPPPSVLKDQSEAMAKMQTEAPPPEAKVEEAPKPTRPERRRRSTPQPPQQQPAPAPVQTASTAPVATDVIGQLSTGGDTSAQNRKQTEDTINSLQRRVDGFPPAIAQSHKAALDQVRDFLRKATEALGSGDIDGANNLATKARLILDDVK